jgi:hypothetical protein
MSRSLTLALFVLLGSAGSVSAQRMTEQYIPIGRSPGVSGTKYALLGTIDSVSLARKTLRITGPQGPVTVTFTDSTKIWIDRSAHGESAQVGSPADLTVGRRIEVKFVSEATRTVADWIKVPGGPGGTALNRRRSMVAG